MIFTIDGRNYFGSVTLISSSGLALLGRVGGASELEKKEDGSLTVEFLIKKMPGKALVILELVKQQVLVQARFPHDGGPLFWLDFKRYEEISRFEDGELVIDGYSFEGALYSDDEVERMRAGSSDPVACRPFSPPPTPPEVIENARPVWDLASGHYEAGVLNAAFVCGIAQIRKPKDDEVRPCTEEEIDLYTNSVFRATFAPGGFRPKLLDFADAEFFSRKNVAASLLFMMKY